jgi:hypothetical protein
VSRPKTLADSLVTNRHTYYLNYWVEEGYGGDIDYSFFKLYQCNRYDIFCKRIALGIRLDEISNAMDAIPHDGNGDSCKTPRGSLHFDATTNRVVIEISRNCRFIKRFIRE